MENTKQLTPGQLVRAAEVAEWDFVFSSWEDLSPETQQRYERFGTRLGLSSDAARQQAETWLHGLQTALEYRVRAGGDGQAVLLLTCLEGFRSNVQCPLTVRAMFGELTRQCG